MYIFILLKVYFLVTCTCELLRKKLNTTELFLINFSSISLNLSVFWVTELIHYILGFIFWELMCPCSDSDFYWNNRFIKLVVVDCIEVMLGGIRRLPVISYCNRLQPTYNRLPVWKHHFLQNVQHHSPPVGETLPIKGFYLIWCIFFKNLDLVGCFLSPRMCGCSYKYLNRISVSKILVVFYCIQVLLGWRARLPVLCYCNRLQATCNHLPVAEALPIKGFYLIWCTVFKNLNFG